MNQDSIVDKVEWEVALSKINVALEKAGDTDKIFEGINPLPQGTVEVIKAMREEFQDDQLFTVIAAGAGFPQIITQWKQEKMDGHTDVYAQKMFDVVSAIDPSITFHSCKKYVLQGALMAAVM